MDKTNSFKNLLSEFYVNADDAFAKIEIICSEVALNLSNVFDLPEIDKKSAHELTNGNFLDFCNLKAVFKCPNERVIVLFAKLFCVDYKKRVNEKVFLKTRDSVRKKNLDDFFDFDSIGMNPVQVDLQTIMNRKIKVSKCMLKNKIQSKSEHVKKYRRRISKLENTVKILRSKGSDLRRNIYLMKNISSSQKAEILALKSNKKETEQLLFDAHLTIQLLLDEQKNIDQYGDNIPSTSVSTRDPQNSKELNPDIKRAIMLLINKHRVPQSKTVGILKTIGNVVFHQKWEMKEKPKSKKRKRKAVATEMGETDHESKVKIPRTELLPSHSYPQKLDKATLPLAEREIGNAIINSKNVSICVDGTDHKREHVMGTSVLINTEKDNGRTVTESHCLNMSVSNATTAESLAEFMINQFRYLSYLCADDECSEASLCETQKKFAEAIKFWGSDGGTEMIPGSQLFGEWQKSLGCNPLLWIKCLAHVVLGLESEADKVIAAIESKVNILKIVSTDLSSSFLENNSKSVYFVVVYALFRLIGKSSDSVSYSMTEEFTTYLKQSGINYSLCDIKKARFGKIFLVGRDMAFLLGKIQDFLENYSKENRLYETCREYVTNYPYLLEYGIVLGIIYFHLILPYMRATGIEGDCYPISQTEFSKLVPALYESLNDLATDPLPLLKKEHSIPCFNQTSNKFLLKFSDNDTFVFNHIFEMIENENIQLSLVKEVSKTMLIKFRSCLERQVGDLYLRGEDSVIQKLVVEDTKAAEVAPVNNLIQERYFGGFKNYCNTRASVSSAYICNKMTSGDSLYMAKLETMDNEKFKKDLYLTKNSENILRANRLKLQLQDKEKQMQENKLKSARQNRLKLEEKRTKNVKQCSDLHKGPVKNVNELKEKILILSSSDQSVSVDAELKYQRDNLKLLATDNPRYKMKRKEKGSMVPIPLPERIGNLTFLLNLVSDTQTSSVELSLPVCDMVSSIAELRKAFEMEVTTQEENKDDSDILKSFSKKDIGAFCSIINYEGKDHPVWWIGQICDKMLSKDCVDCQSLGIEGEIDGVCLKVKELKSLDSKMVSFELKKRGKNYHTRFEQVIKNKIDCVNKPALDPNVYYITPQEKSSIDALMLSCPLLQQLTTH